MLPKMVEIQVVAYALFSAEHGVSAAAWNPAKQVVDTLWIYGDPWCNDIDS